MKSKTASVRLPKDMYEEIDQVCDGIGCSRNDWIKDTLQDRLREENSETEDPRPKAKEPQKISVDGPVNDDTIVRKPSVTSATLIDDNGKETELVKEHDGVFRPKTEEPKEMQNARVIFEPKPEPATMQYIDGQWKPYATRYEV